MILLQQLTHTGQSSGNVTHITVKTMGVKDKANFAVALSNVRWEPLFILDTCEEKYMYYKDVVSSLMEKFFTNKVVTRHTADKPWITDHFRGLIRNRQRAFMSGNRDEYRILRNKVNRASARLRFEFYQNSIIAISEYGSRDWWKNMKKVMGVNVNNS